MYFGSALGSQPRPPQLQRIDFANDSMRASSFTIPVPPHPGQITDSESRTGFSSSNSEYF
jgi:hypothetical protein